MTPPPAGPRGRPIGIKTLTGRPGDQSRSIEFKTGIIESHPDYKLARDGSVRHVHPQFRGTKKQRQRFKEAVRRGLAAPLPEDHREMEPHDIFHADGRGQVWDVGTEAWIQSPFHSCTLFQLRAHNLFWLRGATPTGALEKRLDELADRRAKTTPPKVKKPKAKGSTESVSPRGVK